ncbi:RCC1 domain-containing protein 1-like isoform X1 [Triplophysa rosa]|uniref:RCC1 domain-containing protein 1-like isoform X1 n=1 Tax=Triplophysa rosa TaxID=992332 RepID=UPI002545E793|nr:RCC1 domain-containing protein 1-like isoform X1 [Triplophysa rosa]
MNWFGFGFNGFGQIIAADVKCKVSTPVLLSDARGSDCRVSGSWSSRAAVIHTDSGSRVCVSGFLRGSSGQVCVPESEGCTDASISERHVTVSFTRRVECWEIQQAQNRLVWSREQESSGQDVALPLVPGGYVVPRPPFFRPLCAKLCAVSLALGTEHAVLLTASGTVFTWGSGSHGQLGHGHLTSQEEAQVVEALWGVQIAAVSAGGWHSASVSAGGDLYMWGWNESGQLGLPSQSVEEEKLRARRPGDALVLADVHKGSNDLCVDLAVNQAEEKNKDDVFISIQAFPALVDIPQVSEIIRVACGSRHTAAVTGTGDLYTWGWGSYGQLGHDTERSTDEPALVKYFHSHDMRVRDVVCGLWNTYVSAVPEEPSSHKHTHTE